MPILQYETQIAKDGSITLPLMPEYRDRKVVVYVGEKHSHVNDDYPTLTDEQQEKMYATRRDALDSVGIANKSPEQDFLDFCDELAMPAWSDEDVERIKYERLKEKYS